MKRRDKSAYAIGGCTMIGIGVGLAVLPISVFYFIGAVLSGIGSGLLIASFMPGTD